MSAFRSLRREIVCAYFLFTAACCLLFVVAGIAVVEGVEAHLVDDRLEEVAAWAAPRHAAGLSVEMPTGLSFHHGEAIPPSLRMLPAGVQDIEADGVGIHVLGGRNAAGPFVVIDHDSEYEKVEAAVYSFIALSLLGFLVLSLLLGRYMAHRLVAPISALSHSVASRARELPLLDSNNELGMLARAFDGYARELQLALERERHFTGDVSHELRTPLAIIQGAVDILAREAAGRVALAGPVSRIERAVQDASASVDVLLMLARAPHLIEASEISAGALARRLVEQFQFLIGQKKMLLSFEGGDFRLRVPERLLEAALGNLIRNACLYTEAGAVTVRIAGHRIQVEDSGAGLPPAVLASLQGEQAEGFAGSEGAGLGLTLVRRICERIGATLRVVATSGTGSLIELDCSSCLTKT